MARNGGRRGASLRQDGRPPGAQNGPRDAGVSGVAGGAIRDFVSFVYKNGIGREFAYGAACGDCSGSGGLERHAGRLRPMRVLLGRLALLKELPWRTRAATITNALVDFPPLFC